MTKHRTVSVSEETDLKIVKNNISPTEAMRVGVDMLAIYDLSEEADLMKEKDDLKQEMNQLKKRMRLVEDKLERIREQKSSKKDPALEEKKKFARAIKRNNPLRYKR